MSLPNCGVGHVQDVRTKETTLDQIAFAGNLKTISHPQLTGGRPEDLCHPPLHQLYMSLLGAVAYLAHTRLDVSVSFGPLKATHTKATTPACAKAKQAAHLDPKEPKEAEARRWGRFWDRTQCSENAHQSDIICCLQEGDR